MIQCTDEVWGKILRECRRGISVEELCRAHGAFL